MVLTAVRAEKGPLHKTEIESETILTALARRGVYTRTGQTEFGPADHAREIRDHRRIMAMLGVSAVDRAGEEEVLGHIQRGRTQLDMGNGV